MTIEELIELNLSPQEAKLYQASLELSPATVADLAKKAGIERTASYPYLKSLVKKGLLKQSPIKGRTLYLAESPKRLGEILEEKKKTYQQLLPELMSIFNIKGTKPKIRYFEDRDGMRTILMNSIHPGIKEKLHINPIMNVMEVLGKDWSRRYIEERVKRGIRVKTLRKKETIVGPWEVTAKDKSLLREIRYLPDDFKVENLIIIYLNTVAIISSIRENYGLEIESKEFAETMRSFFNLAWEGAAKYSKK